MFADNLLKINLAWYVVLTIAFLWQGNPGKFLYFLGAAILTIGVLQME